MPELVDLGTHWWLLNQLSVKRIVGDLNRRQPQLAANSARAAASFAVGTVVVRVARPATAVGRPGGRRFSITVKTDLKIAAVITAIG